MNDFKRNDRFGGKPRGGGFGRNDSGRSGSRPQGQMYQTTCAMCGKPTEVPFRPDGQRPIYCREHMGGKPAASSREFQKPAFRAPAPSPVQTPDPRIDDIQKQLAKVQLKLDQLLLSMVVAKAQAPAQAVLVKKKKTDKKK